MDVVTEYKDMTLKEQAGFISHSAAGLVEELYYGGDKTGLEVLVKNLELIAGHAKDCLDCLELIGKKGNVLKKVRLMLEYLGMTDLTGDFVCELEELTAQVQEDFLQTTDGAVSERDEEDAIEKLKVLIRKHEREDIPVLSA